jgi:type III secretory pathway component EscV
MEWQPIAVVGDAEPDEPDSRSGRTPLKFRLSSVPPQEWSAFLLRVFGEQLRKRHGAEMGVPMPQVHRDAITVWSQHSPEQIAGWIRGVQAKVEEANAYYQRVVLPELEQAETATQDADKERKRKVDEARRWIEKLHQDQGASREDGELDDAQRRQAL